MAAEARVAADSLSAALERNDFVGWDPYDALASPGIRALALTPLLRQAARRSHESEITLNIRPATVRARCDKIRLVQEQTEAGFHTHVLKSIKQVKSCSSERPSQIVGGERRGFPYDIVVYMRPLFPISQDAPVQLVHARETCGLQIHVSDREGCLIP